MLTDQRILKKLNQIENRYSKLCFERLTEIPMEMFETREHLRKPPNKADKSKWQPSPVGTKWGDEWMTAWFSGKVKLPSRAAGQKVFVEARTNGETLCFVNGQAKGIFDAFKTVTMIPDLHPVIMMALKGVAGKTYCVDLEAYAGHYFPNMGVDSEIITPTKKGLVFEGAWLVLERQDVRGFVLDLKVLNGLIRVLDENSLRRGNIIQTLARVYAIIDALPQESAESSWRPKLAKARKLMRTLMETPNGPSTPWFGIIGHSHMDTAWFWPLSETWRKCARTYSTALNLMEQYEEYMFLQPNPCHTEVIRQEYPDIFEGMKKMVASGRWEPNGGMWIEPDGNIPCGESFVRQLLIGQNSTREMFGYTSDTLWLLDTFGFSAALPQIIKKSGIDFFCTTKLLNYNEQNRFPYDVFNWKGIDGSSVFAHLHNFHCWPDPESLTKQWKNVQHKDVQDRALCSFGFGDGGGGPSADMLEVARRVTNIEGSPRAIYSSLSNFMTSMRKELSDVPTYSGELYLEGHRGTYTSIAELKRLNRKNEFALLQTEFLAVLATLDGKDYPAEQLHSLWKTVLLNQFHDILPGSAIIEVNDQAISELKKSLTYTKQLGLSAMQSLCSSSSGGKTTLLIANNLSWDRCDEIVVREIGHNMQPTDEKITSQLIKDIDGNDKLIVKGVVVPALGVARVPLSKGARKKCISSFQNSSRMVRTPYANIRFDKTGQIVSFLDARNNRNIVKPNGTLNTFYLGQDVPEDSDNWNIDRDQRLKMKPEQHMLKRQVVADGPLQLRIRSWYEIGDNSKLVQDMVFHSSTSRVDFETVVDWNEKHKLFKVGFSLDILADFARHEIQFGHIERPTHQNLPQDRMKFEVCAHKWTDISESDYGVALLNDCKYGVSVLGSNIALTLIKSGTHPDARGDKGRHVFTYSLLPHQSGFSVDSVVRPAYELNVCPAILAVGKDAEPLDSLLTLDRPNIIVESIKWAEKGKAFIVRLYEAGKTGTKVTIRFNAAIRSVSETNLLEEKPMPLEMDGPKISIYMKAFEIKTLRCEM